ncbi:MAG: V-type ATPase subunit [Clostridiales bacterium]|jgi:V/A-type H+-transporting ATPase subunit C|nr:V-type ATPase subunit [Clostridiales bacterium]
MDYSGINAKISAMRGNLLTRADYESLCGLDSVERVGMKLREYPAYQKFMAGMEGAELHRDMIEQKILLSLSDDFIHIYRFIPSFNIRKYLYAFFLSYEINVIKLLLCMVYDERDIEYSVPELNLLIGEELHLDVAKLKNAKTVAEFIENLRGTGLYSMLSDSNAAEGSLFEMETQMDLYYYMNLWKRQKQDLDSDNRRLMEKIKGTEVDLRNIMCVCRLKKYYRLNDSRIYAYLIPANHKLKRSQLMKMAGCADMEALAAEIARSPYGAAFSNPDSSSLGGSNLGGSNLGGSSLGNLEKCYYREMMKSYDRAAAARPRSLAHTVRYVFYKELELRNLISLLEGVRYRLSPREIMLYLNLPKETEARQWSSG